MTSIRELIKLAVENKVEEFRKVAFVAAPGGQIPPPPGGDPGMGGMPPMDPAMGAMPMDPSMGAMPPMDPAMMGGMPPMPPPGPEGGMPPMDPAMMDPAMMDPAMMDTLPGEEEGGEHINDPNVDWDGSGKPDVMVPLGPITDFATRLIEATKGRKTREADAPKGPGEGGGEGEGAPMDPGMIGGAAAHIGGPPADAPAPIGGMGGGMM